MSVLIFFICLLASGVGAVVGAGGGVIIKPAVDLPGLLPVSTVSFCSGCTVLCMSLASLIRTRKNGVRLDARSGTILALGAVAGGLIGQLLFDGLRVSFGNDALLGAIQSVLLLLAIMLVILAYVCLRDRLPSFHVRAVPAIALIGLCLGLISAFLGIGGGPLNVAVLYLFFSMDAKTAAKNSLYIIVFSQITSLITTLVTGTVPEFQWPTLLLMIAGGIGGAMLGAEATKRMKNSGVDRLLRLLILVVAAVCAVNAFRFLGRMP